MNISYSIKRCLLTPPVSGILSFEMHHAVMSQWINKSIRNRNVR